MPGRGRETHVRMRSRDHMARMSRQQTKEAPTEKNNTSIKCISKKKCLRWNLNVKDCFRIILNEETSEQLVIIHGCNGVSVLNMHRPDKVAPGERCLPKDVRLMIYGLSV